MFIISPKIDDLTHTSLTLTVYDHEAIRSDEIIGQVCNITPRSHDHEAGIRVYAGKIDCQHCICEPRLFVGDTYCPEDTMNLGHYVPYQCF